MINKDTSETDFTIAEFLTVLQKNYLFIAIVTSIFLTFSFAYVSLATPYYKVSTLLMPNPSLNSNGMNTTSNLGSLAGIAGIDLKSNMQVNKVDIALKILSSKKFSLSFLKRRNILKLLNNDIGFRCKNCSEEALNFQIVNHWINKILSIQHDKKSGFIEIAIIYEDDDKAYEWLGFLISDLNNELKNKDIQDSNNSIQYLQDEINKAPSEDLKKVFYSLITSEAQNKMYASSQENYVFEVIDPPFKSYKPFSPNRNLIFIVGIFLGFISSLFYLSIRSFISRVNKQ